MNRGVYIEVQIFWYLRLRVCETFCSHLDEKNTLIKTKYKSNSRDIEPTWAKLKIGAKASEDWQTTAKQKKQWFHT